jgi:hypothetical protein
VHGCARDDGDVHLCLDGQLAQMIDTRAIRCVTLGCARRRVSRWARLASNASPVMRARAMEVLLEPLA